MTKAGKRRKWRIEVVQLSEERIPTLWQRLWGDRGEPWAWQAQFWQEGQKDGAWPPYVYVFGTTRDDVIAQAKAQIAEIEAQEAMLERSREVLHVEGS